MAKALIYLALELGARQMGQLPVRPCCSIEAKQGEQTACAHCHAAPTPRPGLPLLPPPSAGRSRHTGQASAAARRRNSATTKRLNSGKVNCARDDGNDDDARVRGLL